MTRSQSLILNILGISCAVVIFGNMIVASLNSRLTTKLGTAQNQVQRVQNIQNTMNNLVAASSQMAERDPAIKRLLVKHRFVLPDPQPQTTPARR